jgi:hypothetical protein
MGSPISWHATSTFLTPQVLWQPFAGFDIHPFGPLWTLPFDPVILLAKPGATTKMRLTTSMPRHRDVRARLMQHDDRPPSTMQRIGQDHITGLNMPVECPEQRLFGGALALAGGNLETQ